MVDFKEAEVFHFRDLNSQSIYRGASRLEAAQRSIATLYAMKDFQENFFENGAVFGLVLTSENTHAHLLKDDVSEKVKRKRAVRARITAAVAGPKTKSSAKKKGK